MARIKSVRRPKPTPQPASPQRASLDSQPASSPVLQKTQESDLSREHSGDTATNEEVVVSSKASSSHTPAYPTPAASVDDTIEVIVRVPRKSRKQYPSDAPKAPRPPFLPPSMQTGYIQTTKFKCLSAPGAEDGKAAWDTMAYCLDCLRPHLVLYCDGSRCLAEQACSFHRAKYVNNHPSNCVSEADARKSPDVSLRTDEYGRIRKRLERAFLEHGTLNQRPFTAPILEHRESCAHHGRLDGFDPKIVSKLKEALEWHTDGIKAQGSFEKIDTPLDKSEVGVPLLSQQIVNGEAVVID